VESVLGDADGQAEAEDAMPNKHILSLSLFCLFMSLLFFVFVAVCSLLFIYYSRNHRPLSPTLAQSAVLRLQGNDVHMANDRGAERWVGAAVHGSVGFASRGYNRCWCL